MADRETVYGAPPALLNRKSNRFGTLVSRCVPAHLKEVLHVNAVRRGRDEEDDVVYQRPRLLRPTNTEPNLYQQQQQLRQQHYFCRAAANSSGYLPTRSRSVSGSPLTMISLNYDLLIERLTSAMSYCDELADRTSELANHTSKGIDFLERYGNFVKERAAIEEEYAAKLRHLVKRYTPKKKDSESEENQFSYARAFYSSLDELGYLAGQHEVLSEVAQKEILKDLTENCRRLREDRKNHIVEAERHTQSLAASMKAMDKAYDNYSKAFKEAEAASLKYQKADKNLELSRAELLRLQANKEKRCQVAEQMKLTYASQLQATNDKQTAHYNQLLPTVLEKLRSLDENRIVNQRRLLEALVREEKKTLPMMDKCLEDMLQHCGRIQPDKDSEMVLNRLRSGYAPPNPIPFSDFGDPCPFGEGGENGAFSSLNGPPNSSTNSLPSSSAPSTAGGSAATMNGRKESVKRTLKLSHRESFSRQARNKQDDGAPFERCRKYQQKLDQLMANISQLTRERDALLKMSDVYQTDPKACDIVQVEKALGKINLNLNHLAVEKQRFEAQLEEARSQLDTPIDQAFQPSPMRLPPQSAPPPQPPALASSQSCSAAGAADRGGANRASGSLSGESSCSVDGGPSASYPPQALKTASSSSSAANRSPARLRANASPESGIGGDSEEQQQQRGTSPARGQQPGAPIEKAEEVEDDKEIYNEPLLPVIGSATAVYTFDGGSEGTLSMLEGEEVLLVERDEGDGWTRVRRKTCLDEGFVPSSYLHCRWEQP